ncbi:hypothetical protein SVAN01_01969 [Stagonosporopsis vannaccii]|nr:hypothetical protein SVAN01_01969 [Stagonosporopsis vannaccii]
MTSVLIHVDDRFASIWKSTINTPLRYNVELMPWSYPREEPKVYPFIFNPSFLVEDAIPDYDLKLTFDANSQDDDNDTSLMDVDSGPPNFMPSHSLLGKPNTRVSETTTFISPPSPLPPHVAKYTFDTIATNQENLRDARETLMGFRFRLRSKRRELQLAREEAGSKAGAAMSLVKRFLQDQGIGLPDDINSTLSEVDALRDELGAHEVDYEETEERYNREEWRYTQKEEELIEHLETYQPSEITPSNQVAPENHDAAPLLSGVDTVPAVGSQLSQLAKMKDEPNHQTTNIDNDVAQEVVFETEARGPIRFAGVSYDHLARLGGGPTFEDPSTQWRNTRKRVNEWLLETVSLSSYQRQRLKDEQNWAQVVAHHWWSGSPHTSAFRTGDSTIAESIDTLPAAVITPQWHQIRDSASDLDTSALVDISAAFVQEPSGPSPYPSAILLQELNNLPESLIDHDRSPSPPACPPPDNGIPDFALYNVNKPSRLEVLGASSAQDNTPNTPILELDTTAARQKSDEDSPLALSFPPGAGERTIDFLPVEPAMNERADSLHRAESLESPHSLTSDWASQQSSAPFIEVAGPKSWALPLVWLGSPARPRYLENTHVCNFVPFVSLPDTPFRLPGPSQFF